MLLAVVTATLLASLSLVALAWLPASEVALSAIAITLSVTAVALVRGRPMLWFVALLGATTSWAMLLAPTIARVALDGLHGELVRVTFDVARGGCGEKTCSCEAELIACSELEAQGCVASGSLIAVASQTELPLGARITALARLQPRVMFFNRSDTSAWPDTRPQVRAALEPGSHPRVDQVSLLDAWVASARNAIRAGLDHSLRAPHAGIARALILGEGAAVERELNDAIRNAGVSHVLAVSGMHVTLLVGAFVLALRWLMLRTPWALRWEAKRIAAGVGVLLAPLIARLCGASPSAVRAAWTSTLMYLVVALGMRPSALAVSALVVSTYAVCCPRDALHPGFVLSVLATAALLSHQRVRDSGAVLAALRESLRTWLSTAPFLLLCFGQTSLVSLLANVALIPLGTALVPLAALHVGSVHLQLAGLLPSGAVFELASAAFVEAARFCSSLDPGLSLPPLTSGEVLCASAVASAFLLPLSGRVRLAVLVSACASVMASEWSLRHGLAHNEVRISFLDVGQGDAALIETGTGQAALIDAGGNVGGGPDPGQVAVLPLLRSRRIAALDLMVLTHPHPDHYGGLSAVLQALPVRELWDTGQAQAEDEHDDSPVAQLLTRARALGTRIRRPDELCGAKSSLGAARLSVLSPCPSFELTRGPNDNSFVLRLEHGQRSFLFTGDIERETELLLSASPERLRSDVLKVGHHGSRTSSTPPLLKAVSPWLAVVSAGRANRFGHPHHEVVERLTRIAHLLRTDRVGGVQVLSDGVHLRVTSTLGSTTLQR